MQLERVDNVHMIFAYIIDGIMIDKVPQFKLMFSESLMIVLYFSCYTLRIGGKTSKLHVYHSLTKLHEI